MVRSKSRHLLTLLVVVVLGLAGGWGLAFWVSSFGVSDQPNNNWFTNSSSSSLIRSAGPVLSLDAVDQPLDLNYLQQFCPHRPQETMPQLCNLDQPQTDAMSARIPAAAIWCWQRVYDYAFGPLANQAYLGNDLGNDLGGRVEGDDCHQGAITALVAPSFNSGAVDDGQDVARYQDILMIMAAVIEYESYRGRPPSNWSDLADLVNLSYYHENNINAPGTWESYPAAAGVVFKPVQSAHNS